MSNKKLPNFDQSLAAIATDIFAHFCAIYLIENMKNIKIEFFSEAESFQRDTETQPGWIPARKSVSWAHVIILSPDAACRRAWIARPFEESISVIRGDYNLRSMNCLEACD